LNLKTFGIIAGNAAVGAVILLLVLVLGAPTKALEPQWAMATGAGARFSETGSGSWSELQLNDGRKARLRGHAPIPVGQRVCVRGAQTWGDGVAALRRLPDTDCPSLGDVQP
jgi:hypothetical protein